MREPLAIQKDHLGCAHALCVRQSILLIQITKAGEGPGACGRGPVRMRRITIRKSTAESAQVAFHFNADAVDVRKGPGIKLGHRIRVVDRLSASNQVRTHSHAALQSVLPTNPSWIESGHQYCPYWTSRLGKDTKFARMAIGVLDRATSSGRSLKDYGRLFGAMWDAFWARSVAVWTGFDAFSVCQTRLRCAF